MNNAITGKFGTNPEDVMFKPDFRYDRGLDFSGHISSRIIADGVTLMIDGFMEPVSVRDCSGVEIVGLTIDHVRKPYTKGRINLFVDDARTATRIRRRSSLTSPKTSPSIPI